MNNVANCFNGTCHCLFCFAFFFFVRTWRECSSSGPAHLELEDEVGHEDPGQGHQEPPAHNTQRIWCRKYDPRRTCRRGMLTSVPACGPVIISCVLCPVFTYIQVQIYWLDICGPMLLPGDHELKVRAIEEGKIQKKRQRSSRLFEGQNLLNSLPCKLFCTTRMWRIEWIQCFFQIVLVQFILFFKQSS